MNIPKKPFNLPDTLNYRNITVDDYILFDNKYFKPLWKRCNCGAVAMHQITHTSNLTDNTFTIFVCDECLQKYIKYNKKYSS